MNIYEDGTHAVRNALACLIAIRDGVNAGTVELPGGGEQIGNYSSVIDSIVGLIRHPQITAPAMPAHDTPPVSDKPVISGTFIGEIRIEKIKLPPGQGMNDIFKYAVMLWVGDHWVSIEPITPFIDFEVARDFARHLAKHVSKQFGVDPGPGVQTAPPAPMTPNVLWFDMPSNNPDPGHGGAFRVIPSSGLFWAVQQWASDRQWYRPANFAGSYETYWGAIDAVVQWSKQPGFRVPIVRPNFQDLHVWSNDGWMTGEPTRDTAMTWSDGPIAPPAPKPVIEHVYFREGTTPLMPHTFAILPITVMPTSMKRWQIMEWLPGAVGGDKWSSATMSTFETYADAEREIQAWATYGLKDVSVYLVAPTVTYFTKWMKDGWKAGLPAPQLFIGEPPAPDAVTSDPVTIQEAGEVVAAIAESAAIGVKVLSPVIGHRTPSPLGNGFYNVNEWTEDGWQPIDDDDDLRWSEVETRLFPDAKPTDNPTGVGTCEIRPTGDPDLFIVHIWTGKIWKAISGMVAKGTAEGIVRAREMDPENRTAATTLDRVSEYRKAFREVKAKLAEIRKEGMSMEAIEVAASEALQIINKTLTAGNL